MNKSSIFTLWAQKWATWVAQASKRVKRVRSKFSKMAKTSLNVPNMVIFGQKLAFFKNISFFLNPLAGGHFEKNTKKCAFFNPPRPANENRTCSRLLRTPPHHVIYQHDRKNWEIMILDEIWHLDLIFMPFWHFLGPKHVFCVQNYQLGPGDNVAQRDT